MATATKTKAEVSARNLARERFFVDIPQTDRVFFRLFADKMGWTLEDKEDMLDRYIATRPKNVDLTDEDIMEAVREVRYGKTSDNH